MLTRMLRMLCAVTLGFAFSQEPEFLQQYAQRIGGAIDEIDHVLKDYADGAAALGLSLDQAVARRKAAPDPLVVEDGRRIERTIARGAELRAQRDAIASGDGWDRLKLFAIGLDPHLALATASIYVPALPVSTEGGIALVLGFGGGWLGAFVLLGVLKRAFRRRRAAIQTTR